MILYSLKFKDDSIINSDSSLKIKKKRRLKRVGLFGFLFTAQVQGLIQSICVDYYHSY